MSISINIIDWTDQFDQTKTLEQGTNVCPSTPSVHLENDFDSVRILCKKLIIIIILIISDQPSRDNIYTYLYADNNIEVVEVTVQELHVDGRQAAMAFALSVSSLLLSHFDFASYVSMPHGRGILNEHLMSHFYGNYIRMNFF